MPFANIRVVTNELNNNAVYHSLGSAAKTNEVIEAMSDNQSVVIKWITLSCAGRTTLRFLKGATVIFSCNVDVLAPVFIDFGENPLVINIDADAFLLTTTIVSAGAFNINFCYQIMDN